MSTGSPRPQEPSTRPWADWRVWFGILVPIVAIAYTVRGVELRDVVTSIAAASVWGIAAMLPWHIAGLWVRAVRWRHLMAPLSDRPLSNAALFRATAVGFTAINVLPFRIGELARPWFLAKETGVRGSAALGTLVLERAIDFGTLAGIGGIVLWVHTHSLPLWVQSGALLMLMAAALPLGIIIALRWDEVRVLRAFGLATARLPSAIGPRTFDIIEQLCAGVTALRSRRAAAWVLFHSLVLWVVVIPANLAVGLWAFDIELPLATAVLATYTAHLFIALAVAAPSAPGFFGVYHFACREALALFGVAPALSVAYATVVHLTYWIPVTLAGIFAIVQTGTRISDLTAASLGKAGSGAHR